MVAAEVATMGSLTLRVREVSLSEAREMINDRTFTSAVGHESTAQVLSTLLGVEVPPNRIAISLKKGDGLLVFQLLVRLEEGRVLTSEEVEALVREGKVKLYLVEVE